MRRGGGRSAAPAVRAVAIVITAIVCVAGCGAVQASTGRVVTTPDGLLRGTADGPVDRFQGVRYAQPPVGPLRWGPPVPAGSWDGTLDATAPGPQCPQLGADAAAPESEDCLLLNVTTPSDRRPGERLPVVVWWHGGGFLTGSGAEYDPGRLVEQGRVVVVTANYRLGVLGYFGLPGLTGSGSFGFADQLQSLRWTRDNIAAFGGDPDNLTVAGQSAGGLSACALMTSPQLAVLGVDRVAVMSGPCSLDWPPGGTAPGSPPGRPFGSVSSIEDDGRNAARALGCTGPDQLACLRSRPVDDLLEQGRSFNRIAFGTELLPNDPATALGAGPPVPVIYGGTRDEARAFTRPLLRYAPGSFTPTTYPRLLADAFGAGADAVTRRYPLADYRNSAALAWSRVLTDRSWACPTQRDVQVLARRTPTFAYEFSGSDAAAGQGEVPPGAQHSADLPLLFDLGGRDLVSPDQQELADLMIEYWSSFARAGRPDARLGPPWDPITPENPRPLQLGTDGVRPIGAYEAHQCDFWASLG